MTPKQLTAITKHGEQLNAIFHTGLDPVVLCKKLRRIEGSAHKLAEDACNGYDQRGVVIDFESLAYTKRETQLKDRLAQTLGDTWMTLDRLGVFINLDPRGYALKIDDESMRAHNLELYRDWGGYGILAPEFDKDGR
jgi:hypothetical protein